MGDHNTKPCGMTIKLEKDILWAPHRGNDYILGYFDRITFSSVKNWLGFSPRASAVQFDSRQPKAGKKEKTDIPSYPLSGYPIKLLYPSSKTIGYLEGLGLDYQSWQGNVTALLDDYPCATVALVNLTRDFKKHWSQDVCGEQLRHLAQVIRTGRYLLRGKKNEATVPFEKARTEDIHLCILPSLGYSDYCILLAEKDWSFAPVLIEYLHRAAYKNTPILSTDYVMPVYHINPRGAKSEPPIRSGGHGRGIRLSMRVHLKPGAPMGELQRLAGDSIEVCQLSGSSDCMLISKEKEDFSELLRMVMADHNNGSKKIKDLVISTEATLQRSVNCTGETEVWPKFPKPPQNQMVNRLRDILIEYWKILKTTNGHMRLFSATWERVTAIDNICRQPHNRALQKIMDQWLLAFTDCLKRGLEGLTSMNQALLQEKDEDKQKNLAGQLDEQRKRLEEALEIFVTQVGSFLADLSRSDCFSMESERYNHASVSSATALLLAYNQWQNEFVKAVSKEEENNSSQYAFLVRSGGCDRTHTNNIFSDLEPGVRRKKLKNRRMREDLIENMPLITHMSEMALFDCGGAVLRMTHECMHYCGDRLRKQRIDYIFKFTARYFGRLLAYALFSKRDYCDLIISTLKTKFYVEKEELNNDIRACWAEELRKLSEEIAAALYGILNRRYEEDKDGWDERQYMSADLIQWLQTELSSQFLWYQKVDDPFENRYPYSETVTVLYRAMLETAANFYGRCGESIRKEDKSLSFCAVEQRRLDNYLKVFDYSGEYKARDLRRFIVAVLNQLLMDSLSQPAQEKLLGNFGDCNLGNILESVVFSCYSETFADIEACMRLNASLADYILAFVFEEWNVSIALPTDAPYTYRIASVLRVCFPDALNDEKTALTQAAQNELAAAIDNLIRHQMPDERLQCGELVSQIELLLQRYHDDCEWTAEPLEEYLRLCQRAYKDTKHERMERYQRAFKQVRLLEGNVDSDGVTQMFSSLISIGEVDSVEEST